MDFLSPTLPWIRSLQVEWLRVPMWVVSGLGSEPFFLLLLSLLFWSFNRRLGARLAVLLLVSFLANDVCKVTFASPRPFWSGEVLMWARETSFGFPSGHAQASVLVWPFLALQSRRPRFWLGWAFALTITISFSRLVLGVHYPLDLVGGWVIGALILIAWLQTGARLELWWREASWSAQILVALAIVATYALSYALATGGLALKINSEPFALAVNDARSFQSVATRGGATFGLLLGLASAPRFEARTTLQRRVGRVLVGLTGLGLLYIGLKIVLPDAAVFRFARYALATFWIVGGAPWVWQLIGWTREKTPVE